MAHARAVLLAACAAGAAALKSKPLFGRSGLLAQIHEEKIEPRRLPLGQHYWPHARGQVPFYGVANFVGPVDMNSSLAWSWHHPAGRYGTVVVGGALIDGQYNIYVASDDGIRKFGPAGGLKWHYKPTSDLVTCPSLMGTALFGNQHDGHAFALDLETGKELWKTRQAASIGGDTAYVEAHAGVVVMGVKAPAPGAGGNQRVVGVSAMDGKTLWDYHVEPMVWNVMPMFPNDGTVVFMDITGGVHRVGLYNGTRIWHTPVPSATRSFSDGGVILGPDGSPYTCSNPGLSGGQEGQKGVLRKFRLRDGRILWERELEYPCNSWPAVSPDGSVVVPAGSFLRLPRLYDAVRKGNWADAVALHEKSMSMGELERWDLGLPDLRAAIMAFDARTGHPQWRYEVKPWGKVAAAGDEEGMLFRLKLHRQRAACLPAHWSAPTFAADGTVYVGRTNGDLYAYSPRKGAATTYHTGTAPLHPGTSFAHGMMAYTDCDSLYVFHTAG